MRVLVAALALAMLPPLAAGEIYRHVDKDGRVTFTDAPPEGAERIELEPVNTLPGKPAASASDAAPKPAPAAFAGYKTLNIDGPADGSTLRDPSDPLVIGVWSDPPLQPEHRFVILHNGTQENGTSNTLTIGFPERGTHTFVAEIRDAAGQTLIQSRQLQVHVQRASQLAPHRRKTPAK